MLSNLKRRVKLVRKLVFVSFCPSVSLLSNAVDLKVVMFLYGKLNSYSRISILVQGIFIATGVSGEQGHSGTGNGKESYNIVYNK